MKTHISIRINKITEQQIAELRQRYNLQQTEVITMAVDQFYKSKMEDEMEQEKLIGFENFCEWHNPDGVVTDSKLIEAYEVYKKLYAEGGREFADDEICGHPVWNK